MNTGVKPHFANTLRGARKVFVGMSGGVDSSLSASLLLEQGYDVTGVFIKVWQPDFIECTWKQDRLDAMRVASELGIPFVTLDLEKEYKQGVIDYMIEEYRIGRTPNPDVMCNREVKFGAFWKWAKAQGADYIATGHYATIAKNHPADFVADSNDPIHRTNEYASSSHSPAPRHQDDFSQALSLVKSKDENKDQTYFLWTLTEKDLEHVLFPIGHMIKDDVRAEAEKRGLYTSNKKDSQGLCFVGTIDMKTLLKAYIKEEKGNVVDGQGEIIGTHDGAIFYTIGERHGFTITRKSTDDTAYYVTGKDLETNRIVVSHDPPATKHEHGILLEKTSFVCEEPEAGKIYEARGRYRAPLAKVVVKLEEEGWSVQIQEGGLPAQTGIVYTPGQSLVIYDGERCLGGGIMK